MRGQCHLMLVLALICGAWSAASCLVGPGIAVTSAAGTSWSVTSLIYYRGLSQFALSFCSAPTVWVTTVPSMDVISAMDTS